MLAVCRGLIDLTTRDGSTRRAAAHDGNGGGGSSPATGRVRGEEIEGASGRREGGGGLSNGRAAGVASAGAGPLAKRKARQPSMADAHTAVGRGA